MGRIRVPNCLMASTKGPMASTTGNAGPVGTGHNIRMEVVAEGAGSGCSTDDTHASSSPQASQPCAR